MNKIKKLNGEIFIKGTSDVKYLLKNAFYNKMDLTNLDLTSKNLTGIKLKGANLSGTNFTRSDLYSICLDGANLENTNFRAANLGWSFIEYANLTNANLYYADLDYTLLTGSNLTNANLTNANLSKAHLNNVKITFNKFPSIKFFTNINLGVLSDKLTLELMRRDYVSHPYPELFEVWKNGGKCPYDGLVKRYWIFESNLELWDKEKPTMNDIELISAICKEKGWKINK
jgi:hypothetical protein